MLAATAHDVEAWTLPGCRVGACAADWYADLPAGTRPSGAIASGGDVVYVGVVPTGGGDGAVAAYDAGCASPPCAPLVTMPVAGAPTGLAVTGGRLIVTASGVTAFEPADGAG